MVDVEDCEPEVLGCFDPDEFSTEVILYERGHLSKPVQRGLTASLQDKGFETLNFRNDALAFREL